MRHGIALLMKGTGKMGIFDRLKKNAPQDTAKESTAIQPIGEGGVEIADPRHADSFTLPIAELGALGSLYKGL